MWDLKSRVGYEHDSPENYSCDVCMGLGFEWFEADTHEHRNPFLELLPRFWEGSV